MRLGGEMESRVEVLVCLLVPCSHAQLYSGMWERKKAVPACLRLNF